MNALELWLHQIGTLFLTPVLLVLVLMFAHALFSLGALVYDLIAPALTGRRHRPLLAHAAANPDCTIEDLELRLAALLERLRLNSRIAPMLGLVATMIPMGPALIAVANGDSVGMAEQLVVAFSAVIVALLSASMTYAVLLVRRRWLMSELNEWLHGRMSVGGETLRAAEDRA
ncbi:MAG: MotA/TolQ/ExbB proton channel family protein [Gammaproteobacteria bacterium]|jgi:biopolymer transport protein ExbB/TolQ|nr:MotA/TolQ/ExbB proton channel family protein [Gammaproteobacteria bacterium]